jgi:hypothetical protein
MRSLKCRNRASEVLAVASSHLGFSIMSLGLTKGGTPRHPLMLPYDTERAEM